MDKHAETQHTWNNIASLYQDKFMNLDLYNDTYDHICHSLAKRNAKLLDIGCGPGNITQYLLAQRPDFDIFGIDLAPNMIELARKNNPTARFAIMDGRHIHRLETKYDGIIAGFCLPYLSPTESQELIKAAYDLLNEDGLIYLSFVEGDPDQSSFKTGSGGRVFFQYHPLDDLQAHLVRTGFDDIKTFRVRYPSTETAFDIHTILTARRPPTP
ncbi:MAG: class I SAM-dependent methyltransferase [Saprospiraceae bacterium]|nr:class I SAM-dependent methyltransferase [Saprospiraceae bacterium]